MEILVILIGISLSFIVEDFLPLFIAAAVALYI